MRKHLKEKVERALGEKLFLKAERCNSPKCVMVRRPYRPGMHGAKRQRRPSDYSHQLREKQKMQWSYGLTNHTLQRVLEAHEGNPEAIIKALERRLDSVTRYLGFAPSIRVARQLVSHGHILVNGRKVTISSYEVRKGDIMSIRPESRGSALFNGLQERLTKQSLPTWLTVDPQKLSGTCTGEPTTDALELFDVSLVATNN